MYPFRRILIPTDFSTASEWAFDDAVRIAGENAAEIVILHIRMTWESEPSALRLPADESVYEYAEQLELSRLRDRVRRLNPSIATRLVVKKAPDPGLQICTTATQEEADLIVIATHARHHVAHLFVGSTTLSIISDPPAPVLAVRYGTRKRERLRRIMVPVHPAQGAHAALDLAIQVARHTGAEIHMLTVCGEKEEGAAEALLKDLASRAGVSTVSRIIRGSDAAREIVRHSDKADADVLFLNADQQLSEAKVDIIRHASMPVMIVPVK